MTEKRYKIQETTSHDFIDTITGQGYCYGEGVDLLNEFIKDIGELRMLCSDVVVLLNELKDDYNQLESDYEYLEKEYKEIVWDYSEEEEAKIMWHSLFEKSQEECKELKRLVHLLRINSMFSTVKSFYGDISERYVYSNQTDTIYDTANSYGQYDKILNNIEITMLLNEYETLLNNKNGDVNE